MALSKNERTRNWSFVVYPESLPENWLSMLGELCVPCCVSPLHDKDLNADGTEKKAHYHIVLAYDGKKSYEQILEVTQMFNGTIPQKVANMKGIIRYLIHADNPEKAQYSKDDIKAFGGLCVDDYLVIDKNERYIYIREMMNYVKDNGIVEFKDLLEYAAVEKFDTWFKLLCDSSAYVMQEYIKSCRHYKS